MFRLQCIFAHELHTLEGGGMCAVKCHHGHNGQCVYVYLTLMMTYKQPYNYIIYGHQSLCSVWGSLQTFTVHHELHGNHLDMPEGGAV